MVDSIAVAAHQWLPAALNGIWQGLAVAALVALALRLWPRSNASTRFVLYAATLLVAFALPAVNGLDVGAAIGSAVQLVGEPGTPVGGAALVYRPDRDVLFVPTDILRVAPLPAGVVLRLPPGGWVLLVLAAWLLGTSLLLLRLTSGYLQTLKLRWSSLSLAPRYQHRLNLLASRCKVARPVVVRGSNEVASPVVVGMLHHVILLPVKVAGDLTNEELDQVLMHELAHLRRNDPWWNLLQGLTTAVGCGLPAVWWLSKRMDLEREIACDDWVVNLTGRRKSYATCLMRLVQLGTWSRVPILVSGAAKGRSHFSHRIFLLLDRHCNRDIAVSRPAAIVLGGALAILAIGLCACSNPFAPPLHKPDPGKVLAPAPQATTPELVIANLHRAMQQRDKDLYEGLIDGDFWFTELDCAGDLVLANGREEELEIMGTRDGSHRGILDIFDTFDFNFSVVANGRSTELARDYPDAFPGDPDGHPDEDWEVFRGRAEMLMVDHQGDGFRVNQVMTYKLRKDAEGLWRMIRWADDPLSGDCGGAELTATVKPAGIARG